jgi:hypothetical protein
MAESILDGRDDTRSIFEHVKEMLPGYLITMNRITNLLYGYFNQVGETAVERFRGDKFMIARWEIKRDEDETKKRNAEQV